MAVPDHTVRRVDAADAQALTDILASSFQDDPPLMWIIPDPDDRKRLGPGFFRPFVDLILAHGEAYTTESFAGVAMWLDVDVTAAADDDCSEFPQRLIDGIGNEYADRFFLLDELFAANHPTYESHAYLPFIGVAPERQNQGIGTFLIADRLAALDTTGRPAYLEASSARNAALYARLGFTPIADPIALPQGPRLYPMWRPPSRISLTRHLS